MHTRRVYAEASKCFYGAKDVPFLRFFIEMRVLIANPAKVKTILDRLIHTNEKASVIILVLPIAYTNIAKI